MFHNSSKKLLFYYWKSREKKPLNSQSTNADYIEQSSNFLRARPNNYEEKYV